jgi:hypothetical protein
MALKGVGETLVFHAELLPRGEGEEPEQAAA